MLDDWQERTRLLIGDDGIDHLASLHVLVAGVGGVGGHVVESLARAGVGCLTLIDMDDVSISNRNRQLVALTNTVGQSKVHVMAERIAMINPQCRVVTMKEMVCQNADELLRSVAPDVVVDAIDSLNCKVALLLAAVKQEIPVYSSMGAGRRMDVRQVAVMDVMDTQGCGLARQVRHRLRKAGVQRGIVCVASSELPAPAGEMQDTAEGRPRVVNGTISYMPAIFGLMLAGTLLQAVLQVKTPRDKLSECG